MRRSLFLMAVLGLSLGLVAGCGQTDSADEGDTAQATNEMTESTDGHEGHDHGTPAENASVTLSGNLGCGHCTFHATDACAVAMKTADGEIVLIEAADGTEHEELMSHRMDEPEVRITGTVREVDGRKVIYADEYEL